MLSGADEESYGSSMGNFSFNLPTPAQSNLLPNVSQPQFWQPQITSQPLPQWTPSPIPASREQALTSLSQINEPSLAYAPQVGGLGDGGQFAYHSVLGSNFGSPQSSADSESSDMIKVDPDHELEYEFQRDMGMIWRPNHNMRRDLPLPATTDCSPLAFKTVTYDSSCGDWRTDTQRGGQERASPPAQQIQNDSGMNKVLSTLDKLGGKLQRNARQQIESVRHSDLVR